MQPQLTETYSTKENFKDEEVTIKGETYNLPIHQSQNKELQFNTKIEFICRDIVLKHTIYFEPQMTLEELTKEVDNCAKHLDKVFKIN